MTLNPGNRIEVFPAAAGRLFVSVTETESPSVTINVGPGICIFGQVAPAMPTFPVPKVLLGANPLGVPLHP